MKNFIGMVGYATVFVFMFIVYHVAPIVYLIIAAMAVGAMIVWITQFTFAPQVRFMRVKYTQILKKIERHVQNFILQQKLQTRTKQQAL